jgi:hypothetical protein
VGHGLHVAGGLRASRVVGGIHLGEHHRCQARRGAQLAKHVTGGVEPHPGPVMREVAKGQVTGVDGVDVEVHHQRPGGRGQRRHGLAGDARRVCPQLVVGDVPQARPDRQDAGVEGLGVALVITEQEQVIVVQDGRPAVQPGQFGVGQAEQVGDPHRVEDAAAGPGRGAQVGVTVEVGQRDAGVVPLYPGDHTEGDRAVAAEHDGHRARAPHAGDGAGDGPGDAEHRAEIGVRRVVVVGGEHLPGDVAGVLDIEASSREALGEAVRAQRGRGEFLARVMRAGTGRHPDDGDPGGRHGVLPSHIGDHATPAWLAYTLAPGGRPAPAGAPRPGDAPGARRSPSPGA